jgi:hypothetical protein
MNEVSVNEPMDLAALDQLARASASRAAASRAAASRAAASRAADIIDKPRRLRAIATVVGTTPRQFAADRARRATQKLPD